MGQIPAFHRTYFFCFSNIPVVLASASGAKFRIVSDTLVINVVIVIVVRYRRAGISDLKEQDSLLRPGSSDGGKPIHSSIIHSDCVRSATMRRDHSGRRQTTRRSQAQLLRVRRTCLGKP